MIKGSLQIDNQIRAKQKVIMKVFIYLFIYLFIDLFIHLFTLSLMLTIAEQILFTIKNSSKMLNNVNTLAKNKHKNLT